MLLVEDIVDSGLTLEYLLKNLAARKPAVARGRRPAAQAGSRRWRSTLRYIGFDIPPEFVVGYGLDYAERYRNLPTSPRSSPRPTAADREPEPARARPSTVRSLLVVLAVSVSLTACASSAEQPTGGISGTVTTGPTCPVEIAGSPCPPGVWIGTVRATATNGAR